MLLLKSKNNQNLTWIQESQTSITINHSPAAHPELSVSTQSRYFRLDRFYFFFSEFFFRHYWVIYDCVSFIFFRCGCRYELRAVDCCLHSTTRSGKLACWSGSKPKFCSVLFDYFALAQTCVRGLIKIQRKLVLDTTICAIEPVRLIDETWGSRICLSVPLSKSISAAACVNPILKVTGFTAVPRDFSFKQSAHETLNIQSIIFAIHHKTRLFLLRTAHSPSHTQAKARIKM